MLKRLTSADKVVHTMHELHAKHFTSEKEVEEVLNSHAHSTRSLDMKVRIEQQEKYIRRLRGRLRELSRQKDSFYTECLVFERDALEKQSETAYSRTTILSECQQLKQKIQVMQKQQNVTNLPVIVENSTPEKIQSKSEEESKPPQEAEKKISDDEEKKLPEPEIQENIRERSSSVQTHGEDEDEAFVAKLDTKLQQYVRNAMKVASQKLEDKWIARLTEQTNEHENALTAMRERCSESVFTNSKLVADSIQEKDANLKRLEEENTSAKLQLKQLGMDLEALNKELHITKERLRAQDEEKSVNAKSFWQVYQ